MRAKKTRNWRVKIAGYVVYFLRPLEGARSQLEGGVQLQAEEQATAANRLRSMLSACSVNRN